MAKQVADYILDCLRALERDEGEGELGARIRAVRAYWEELWGGALPQDERVFAAFISNDPGSTEPKDLWFFSAARCIRAREFMSPKLDLTIFPFKTGIRRMRVAKNYDENPGPGSRLVVALWFGDDSNAVLEAADANCVALGTLIEEVVVPSLL